MFEALFESADAYNILSGIGFAAALIVCALLAYKRKALDFSFAALCVVAAVGLFLGAHLMYFIVGLPDFISYVKTGAVFNMTSFIDAVLNYSNGLVFYGGLLGALLALFIALKRTKATLNMRENLNNFVVVFPLFHAFGRIGCTLNGCCYGIEYHGIFALTYTQEAIRGSVNADIADFPRFPVQPLEAALEFILFGVLLFIYLKYKDKYSLTCIYLLSYSVIRFFDEFLRGDSVRGIWGPFSTSQWISLFVFAGVIIYLLIRRKGKPSPEASAA